MLVKTTFIMLTLNIPSFHDFQAGKIDKHRGNINTSCVRKCSGPRPNSQIKTKIVICKKNPRIFNDIPFISQVWTGNEDCEPVVWQNCTLSEVRQYLNLNYHAAM